MAQSSPLQRRRQGRQVHFLLVLIVAAAISFVYIQQQEKSLQTHYVVHKETLTEKITKQVNEEVPREILVKQEVQDEQQETTEHSSDLMEWPPTAFIDALLDDSTTSSTNAKHTSTAGSNSISRLIVAAANLDYVDFADNFANSLLALNITNFVLVPLDSLVHDLLSKAYPANTLPLMPGLSHSDGTAAYGTEEFKQLTASRPFFLKSFLQKGYAVFYNDIDIVWRRNAWDVIDKRRAVAQDNGTDSTTIESTLWMDGLVDICTCMIYLLPTVHSISLMEKWEEEIRTEMHNDDQKAFRVIAEKMDLPFGGGIKGTIQIYPLDNQFRWGRTYDWNRYPNENDETVTIHNNWIEGKLNKLARFISAGFWNPSGRIESVMEDTKEKPVVDNEQEAVPVKEEPHFLNLKELVEDIDYTPKENDTQTLTPNEYQQLVSYYTEFFQKVVLYLYKHYDTTGNSKNGNDNKNEYTTTTTNAETTMRHFLRQELLPIFENLQESQRQEEKLPHTKFLDFDITSFVELSHCSRNMTDLVNTIDWKDFLFPYVTRLEIISRKVNNALWTMGLYDPGKEFERAIISKHVEFEFLLQLLEMYVQMKHPQLCQYGQYPWTLIAEPSVLPLLLSTTVHAGAGIGTTSPTTAVGAINNTLVGLQLQQLSSYFDRYRDVNNDHPNTDASVITTTRIVYVISAHLDVQHLEQLIDAIYLPQHYIIIHIDDHASFEFRQSIQNRIVSKFSNNVRNNVVVVQFGAIIYLTNTVNTINYKILGWISTELQLDYDFVMLMDGLSYPLVSATELLYKLHTNNREVYIGELLYRRDNDLLYSLYNKKLMYATRLYYENMDDDNARGNISVVSLKYDYMLHENLFRTPPTWKRDNGENDNDSVDPIQLMYEPFIKHKSNSGNSGIYSRMIVEKLLQTDLIRQMFALSKYGDCCFEEYNWIAAIYIIDHENNINNFTSHNIFHEAYDLPSHLFQVWGGSPPCQGGVSNAILSIDTNTSDYCYNSADAHFKSISTNNITGTWKNNHFYGSEMMGTLLAAKQDQTLTARKFSSTRTESHMEFLQKIRTEIWNITSGKLSRSFA